MAGQNRVVMYATQYCGYCMAARMLLKKKGIDYEEISVSGNEELRSTMEQLSGRRSVPQIFIDGRPVGGFDELDAMDADGTLERLLGRSD